MDIMVHLETQGSLVKASVNGYSKTKNNLYSTPKRGEVLGFSQRSRKRMLEKLSRLETKQVKGHRHVGVFLTLTMKALHHPRTAKRYLFKFITEMIDRFPDACGYWKMEFQERGAVHFHLILFNLPFDFALTQKFLVSSIRLGVIFSLQEARRLKTYLD